MRFNAGFYGHASVDRYHLGTAGERFVYNATLARGLKEYYLGFVVHQDPNLAVVGSTRKGDCGAGGEERVWVPQYGEENNVLQVNETEVGWVRDVDAEGGRYEFFGEEVEVVRV